MLPLVAIAALACSNAGPTQVSVPTALAITVQPSNATAGTPITPAVQVTIRDAAGNTVPTATNSVTIAIGTNPAAGTLVGTTTVSAISGVATFANLSINKAGTGYTLVAAAAGLTGATSSAFAVTAGAATKLAFSVQPSNAAAGATITPAVQVAIQDAQANTVTSASTSVTVALGTNPAGGTLSGTTTVAAVSGMATFSTLSIDKAGTGYTLTAAATGLSGAASSGFNVMAGATPVPTLVQHVTTPNTGNTGGSPFSTSLKMPLPNATLSGNAFIVVVQAVHLAGQTVTCADNVGNTYTQQEANGGSVGFHGMWLFTASNTTAGATSVTCTFSVATSFMSGAFSEWQNVATAPFDVGNTAENTTSTTSWAGGSATTRTTGDLVYQCAQSSTAIPYRGASFVAQSGFTLGSADLGDGLVCQWQVQSSAGPVNPTITANPSAGYVSAWAALKPASQGTAPTVTPRIVHLQHSNPGTTATSGRLQFPSSGNLLHVSFISGQPPPSGLLTALSSSPANTWTQVTGSPCEYQSSIVVQQWYAASASTASSLTLTFALGSVPAAPGQDFIFYDITGAASSPVDTQRCATGVQTVPGNLTTVSVTPGATGELSIFAGDHNISTLTGTVRDGNGHLPLFNMPTWGGEDLCTNRGANNEFTLDASAADYNNTDVTQQTAIYTETTCATAEWAQMVVVYKPGP